MDWNDGSWGWAGWTMMVVMLAFWALVAWGVVAVARSVGGSNSSSPRSTPEGVLAERFARGEIDEDDYLNRRDVLQGARPPKT